MPLRVCVAGVTGFVAVDPDQILDSVEPFLIECGAAGGSGAGSGV